MKILLVHNKYKFRGGEDIVVETMEQLLKGKGLSGHMMIKDSQDIKDLFVDKLVADLLRECSILFRMKDTARRRLPWRVQNKKSHPPYSTAPAFAFGKAAIGKRRQS